MQTGWQGIKMVHPGRYKGQRVKGIKCWLTAPVQSYMLRRFGITDPKELYSAF